MKKILVPTDFSEHAYAAAEVAASIAKKNGARVFLLHVVNLSEYGDEEEISKQLFIMKLIKKRMNELVNQPFFEGVNVAEALQFDLIYENIGKHAKDNDIDLIVMGSHGSSGFREFFVGSNAQKVVRTSDCPVLTVKSKPENLNFENIVFASNFYSEIEPAFRKLQDFTDMFESKIHLVRVVTPYDFEVTSRATNMMEDFAKKMHLKDYTKSVYNAKVTEAGILEFGNSVNADLIALATHGRTGLNLLISGSQAEGVVNHSDIPVMSVRIS